MTMQPAATSDGCCDYLITPAVDLRESEGYALIVQQLL